MTLHLIKLCVGAASIDDLAQWQRKRLAEQKRKGEKPRLFGGSRDGVSSYGSSMRVNLLGFLIAEVALVHPNDRPGKGWFWEFNLAPGF